MWTEAAWLGSENNQSNVPTPGIIDFWDTDRPASHLNGTGYEELIFRDRMVEILRSHDLSQPLFLNYDSKVAHYPLQVPQAYQDKFAFIEDDNRRVYHAMVNFLDDQLLNITTTMKELGMWNNTLMILSSDNGGYVKAPQGACNTTTSSSPRPDTDIGHGTTCFNGEAGANNYPLRGGKYTMFEGGIRVNAFVSGGFVPPERRGTTLNDMIHIADWYGTLCDVAGVEDCTDASAAKAGLPPVDSVSAWPYLSGQTNQSARSTILVTKDLLVDGEWKYVAGGTVMTGAAWGGPRYPNASTSYDPIFAHDLTCPPSGCLFNVVEDVREEHEVSAQHPDVVQRMKTELDRQRATIWSTDHKIDPECYKAAKDRYGNFYGPWKEV